MLVAIPVAALALSGVLRPLTDPVGRLVRAAAAPAYAAGSSITRAVNAFFDEERADKNALASAVENLRIENAKLRELAVENEALKAALSFAEREQDPALLARVVSETDVDVFHGLIIDRGSEDGVRPGHAVVVGEGIIVGKVFETRRRTSSVLLLSDSKSRLAVAVQNATDTVGVLEGDRGLSTSIDLIPQTETLSPGDIVVTSGIEPGIRRGLAVGTIEKVTKRTQDPFQSATVVPFTAAAHPPFVQVLTSTLETRAEEDR
jgi:rod shape-determining protein MreC